MNDGRHEVVINISASPEQIWAALTSPQQTRLFWHGANNRSLWRPGAPWTSESDEGELYLDGEIVEVDRPQRMVHTMRFLQDPAATAEGPSLVDISIDAVDGGTRLRLVNTNLGPTSLENVTAGGGWEHILGGLKVLLETGHPLESSVAM
ncbi:MAG TPA: SRPBCC domain-containing protein [Candidatus Limnocylindrales bacterium]|jgi:uncharacterized protein YndB with AHSA1/START domain